MEYFNQFIGEVITAMPPLRPEGMELEILISVFYDVFHSGKVAIIEHEHPFYEIAWMQQGEMDYLVDGVRITNSAENHQAFFLPPGKLHRRGSESESSVIRSLEISLTPTGPRGSAFRTQLNEVLSQCGYRFVLNASMLSRLRLIEEECRRRRSFSRVILHNEISALLLDILQTLLPLPLSVPEAESSHSEINHYILMRIEDLVNRPFEMGVLTWYFNLSARHLNRIFRAEHGMSIRQYAALRRAEHAERLLRNPGNTVADVASALGFCSPSHFITFFKKYHKLSPARYREQFRHSDGV